MLPNGFTKWNSQPQMGKGITLPIAAADVVEPAGSTRSDQAIKQMESIVKNQDMVAEMPYPPPFFNDEPLIPSYGAKLKDTRKNKETDTVGAMDLNPILAYRKTLGEVIERFCQMYPTDKVQLKFDKYSNLMDNALDPVVLFPFENLNSEIFNKDFYWVTAKKYGTKEQVRVPSRLVYLHLDEYDFSLDSIRTTNGTAFGYNYEDAVFAGFCEVLERDAFFMHYLAKTTPPRIDISAIENGNIKRLIEYFSRYHLELHVFDISLEFEPKVIMSIIIDRSEIGPSIGIGTSCGVNPERSVIKAILEAQQIRLFSRRAKLEGENSSSKEPLKERALMWYGKENIEKIDFFLNSDEHVQMKETPGRKEDILSKFPHEIYVCDLSLPDMFEYKVVKVVIPKCVPLYFDDSYIPKNLKRLKRYLGEKDINPIPHPFI